MTKFQRSDPKTVIIQLISIFKGKPRKSKRRHKENQAFAINVLVTMQEVKGMALALIKCELVQDLLLVQIITRAQKYKYIRSTTEWSRLEGTFSVCHPEGPPGWPGPGPDSF